MGKTQMTEMTEIPNRFQELPEYVLRLLGAARPGSGVLHVVVAHASHCRHTHGEACTCTPDMTLQDERQRLADVDAIGMPGQAVRAS